MHNHLLVLILLTSPIDPHPSLVPDNWPAGLAALREICDALDVTDSADHWGTFGGEIGWARTYVPKVVACPPSILAETLPGIDVCNARWCFASEVLCHWQDAAIFPGRNDALSPWIADQQWRVACWRTASEVRNEKYRWCRRMALQRLWEMTDGGQLPSHVPLEAFRRMP